MTRGTALAAVLVLAVGSFAGCSSSSDDSGDSNGELGQSPEEVKEQIPGPVAKETDAEVWAVENAWADTATANAKKAGVAWGENSGLSWEEKYRKWIAAFAKVDGRQWGKTIQLQNPQGRALDGPVLECADFGIFLRLTFSAFYHLPFYMTGYANGRNIYMGHFGVVDKDGNPVPGYPHFKAQYKDYEGTWKAGQAWPHDPSLRATHVGQDDGEKGVHVGTEVLGDTDGAGSYMDELFLNKRVGYLQHYLDAYFGSVNLADGANMFHIKPESTAVGDALLERYNKSGIGHPLSAQRSTQRSVRVRSESVSGPTATRHPFTPGT